MKILGTGNGGYIVHVSYIDMAKLLGFRNLNEQHREKQLHVGDDVELGKIFDRITYLKDNQDKMAELADELYRHADALLFKDPVIKGLEKDADL